MRDSTTCWSPGCPHILFATKFCSASFPCPLHPCLCCSSGLTVVSFVYHSSFLASIPPHGPHQLPRAVLLMCTSDLSHPLLDIYHGSLSPQLAVWASLEDHLPYPCPIQSLSLTCPHPPQTYILATKSLVIWLTWQSVVCQGFARAVPCLAVPSLPALSPKPHPTP